VAQGGTEARKAKATLHDVDTREVSTVDRPAIGETFLMVKSEGGVAKTTGAAGKVKKDEIADAAPPKPKVTPSGEPDAPAAIEAAAKDDEEVAMALPPDAKTAFIAGLTAGVDRLTDLLALATGASDSIAVDGEETPAVPGDYLVKVLDAADGIAKLVAPYVASVGMVDDTEKGADGKEIPRIAKADGSLTPRCTWTQEYIDSLSDWCFLEVTAGPIMNRDTEYRTLPLSSRHFPTRDHDGRMCLAAVLDAIDALATPSPSLTPWLTESKRLELLLRLACERLHEVKVAIRRDGMSPESAAELNGIAEMLVAVSAAGAPAPAVDATAAAPAAAPPVPGVVEADKAANPAATGSQPIGPAGTVANVPSTGGTPPKDVPLLKAAEFLRRLAKSGGAPMTAEHHETLKAVHACMAKAFASHTEAAGHLEKCLKAVDPFFDGKLGNATPQDEFGKPPVAGAPNPTGAVAHPADAVSQPAEAQFQKALADLAETRKQLTTVKADNIVLKSRVAKAERRPTASNSGGHSEVEPTAVAKNDAVNRPLSMDLNEVIKREEIAKAEELRKSQSSAHR
jgi:hypothetical protein